MDTAVKASPMPRFSMTPTRSPKIGKTANWVATATMKPMAVLTTASTADM